MTYTTTSEVLIQEDLSPYISNLSPADTPLHRLCSRYTMKQKIHEYGVDRFNLNRTPAAIAGADGARTEGATLTQTAADIFPERYRSVAQINWDLITVTGTDRASQMAGITDPFEYRIYKLMVDINNRQELFLHWGTGSLSTASPRLSQGVAQWCGYTGLARSSGSAATSMTDPNGNVITPSYWSNMYNAAGSNLDLPTLTDKIIGVAVDNGFPLPGSYAICGRKLKSQVSQFTLTAQGNLNNRNIPAYDNFMSDNISFIETSFAGVIGLSYDRYFDLVASGVPANWSVNNTGGAGGSGLFNASMPCNETLLIFQPQYVQVGTLRGLGWGPMPHTIDGDSGVVLGEESLIVRNPVAICGGINLLAV